MAYIKQTWEDNPPSTATPINATRLNHLETQYDEALAEVPHEVEQSITQPGPVRTQLDQTIATEVQNQTSGLQGQIDLKADRAELVIDGITTEALLPGMPPGVYVVEP